MRMRLIVICGMSGHYHIFPHYLINGTDFGGKKWNIKCVLVFYLKICSETIQINQQPDATIFQFIF
jgi:hypothetical protein